MSTDSFTAGETSVSESRSEERQGVNRDIWEAVREAYPEGIECDCEVGVFEEKKGEAPALIFRGQKALLFSPEDPQANAAIEEAVGIQGFLRLRGEAGGGEPELMMLSSLPDETAKELLESIDKEKALAGGVRVWRGAST